MERKIVERLLLGEGLNQICRELKVSKRRVMTLRARADELGYLDGSIALPPYPEAIFPDIVDGRSQRTSAAWQLLTPYLDWIKERLAAGWHAVTVFEELPVRVPRSSFYRFILRHKLNTLGVALRRVVPEIVHRPGEALLVDWGHLWTVEQNGRRVKLWAFIAVLGYSRFMVVKLMTRCTLVETLDALRHVFEGLGGVAGRTTSDNPKVFAAQADKYEPILNPAYERFAGHYGTLIECLPPRAPEKKGKVERPVPYIRRLLEGYVGDRNDVQAIQAYLDRKIELANQRRHGTTHERPIDRFVNEERAALKPLPLLPYELEEYHEGAVRADGHVRFRGKYYSVAEQYVKENVTVLGDSKKVSIYHKGKLIEVHDRITDRYRFKSTKPHHRKPWELACENPNGLCSLAAKIGPQTEVLVDVILRRGDGFIDLRCIWGILSLDKKFRREDVEAACEQALALDSCSYQFVKSLLEAKCMGQKEETTPPPGTRPAGKFQRDLSEYQQLLLNLKPEGGTYEH